MRVASLLKQKKQRIKQTSKADVAILIEKKIQHLEPAEKQRLRQELSVPVLDDLKQWLDKNVTKLVKKSLTRIAIEYTLNQWDSLQAAMMTDI